MMKGFLLVGLLIIGKGAAFAQELISRNAVYFELCCSQQFISLNYERKLANDFNARGGFSIDRRGITLPVLVGKTFGTSGNKILIQVGAAYLRRRIWNEEQVNGMAYSYEIENSIAVVAWLGYQYTPPSKNTFYRIGYSPIFGKTIQHRPAIGIGYNF